MILESSGFYEQDLTPGDRLSFRIGSEPAELARFDVVIDAKAKRADHRRGCLRPRRYPLIDSLDSVPDT